MNKTAVILVDHGSKIQAANRMLEEVASAFAKLGEYDIIKFAHMELCEPSLAQAIAACADAGADTIIVHPYFLSPGRHSTNDIPRMVAEAARAYPNIRCQVTEPLGLHPVMNQIILDRVRETEQAMG